MNHYNYAKPQSYYGPGALLGAALVGAGVVWIASSLSQGGGHKSMRVHPANNTLDNRL